MWLCGRSLCMTIQDESHHQEFPHKLNKKKKKQHKEKKMKKRYVCVCVCVLTLALVASSSAVRGSPSYSFSCFAALSLGCVRPANGEGTFTRRTPLPSVFNAFNERMPTVVRPRDSKCHLCCCVLLCGVCSFRFMF